MLPLLVASQGNVGPLVVRQSFLESILPMKYVANVVFKTGQVLVIAQPGEDLFGSPGSGEGALVFAHKNQGLNGAAEGSCGIIPTSTRDVDLVSPVVVLHGRMVFSAGMQRIAFRSQGNGHALLATKFSRDQHHPFCEA